MEFLDPLEAEKFKKQKCVQFCGTPCSNIDLEVVEKGILHPKKQKTED